VPNIKATDWGAKYLKESQDGTIDLPDEPAVIKLLMQYLYEGEYDPLLPDIESLGTIGKAAAKVRPAKALDGKNYNYGFPHTCDSHGHCYSNYVCPHHVCRPFSQGIFLGNGSRGCDFRCKAFNCNICNPLAPPVPSLNGTSDQLLTHAKMYEIADKYDVVGLKDLVKEKFGRSCQHFWDEPTFASAAHYAFLTTPDHDEGLRDIISRTITDHIKVLVKKPEIKVLLKEFNDLAYGLLKMTTDAGWE
jgi:hypothetical protein